MFMNLNSAGYDLYEVTPNEWIMNVKNGPLYVGTFKKVVKHAVIKMGFSLVEIEVAVDEMLKKGHNAAHFGMSRGFISTFNKDFPNVRKAS